MMWGSTSLTWYISRDEGLFRKEPTGMTGYKSVKLVRKELNRGSVIWVRADYMDIMVRV